MKIIGKGNKVIFTLDDYKKYAPPKKEYLIIYRQM